MFKSQNYKLLSQNSSLYYKKTPNIPSVCPVSTVMQVNNFGNKTIELESGVIATLASFTYRSTTDNTPFNRWVKTSGRAWDDKLWLLLVVYHNLEFVGKFRHRVVKSTFNLIFFEDTITLKNIFFFWVKLMPLRIHKKLIITLTESMLFIQFFTYLFSVQFKILFYIKGKLGLQGDNKKKKKHIPVPSRD